MAKSKKVALILSGCGVFDGSEIHESVLALLAIDKAGSTAECFAPNIPLHHVINHLTNQEERGDVRNVLNESARIARGKVRELVKAKVSELDAAIFPGGFGAAKNLSNFAFDGPRCDVQPAVAKFIGAMHEAGKPMGFICIAPVIIAKLLGPKGVTITVGTDGPTKMALAEMGATHTDCAATEICIDKANKIVTAPGYMLPARITELADGIDKCVRAVLDMA